MYFIEHGMQILTGIGILVAGLFCSRWAGNVAQRWLEKHKLEPQIRKLITKLVWLVVFAMFVIVALGQMGIQITPLLAGIGVAGVHGLRQCQHRLHETFLQLLMSILRIKPLKTDE